MTSPADKPVNILLDEIEKPIDYKYYFYLFKKNIPIVITFLIIAATVSSIYAAKLPDAFQATAQLLVERPQTSWESMSSQETMKSDTSALAWGEDYYITQQEIILGPTVLEHVIKQLKLNDYFENDDDEALMWILKSMLTVIRIKNSRIFNITAKANDPKFTANLANVVAENYIRKNFEDNLYYNKEILNWLSQGGKGKSKLITIQDPLGKIRKMKYEDFVESLPAIQADPNLRSLIKKRDMQLADLETLSKQYGEKHPRMIKARTNLKFLEDGIDQEKKRIIDNMKAKAEGQLQSQQGRIIEQAKVPEVPIGPQRLQIVGMACIACLMITVIGIFLIDYFDDTIRIMEDLERKGILIPFLGPLPLIRGKFMSGDQSTVLTKLDEEIRTEIAEAFRYLRVAINFSAPPDALKLLAVTSCLPSEGKSFTALNIAVSLAMDGNKTLLVDADLRRPKIHRSFDMDNSSGLSNYLTSDIDLEPFLKESFIENLYIITSGPLSPNPSEILGSERMKALLQDSVKNFDRVIIDCPPLTGIGDGFVVGSLIGHLILIVCAGKTPADLIRHTQQQLDKMGVKILGMVLNKMDVEKERYGGYTKHYYRTYNKYYKRSK